MRAVSPGAVASWLPGGVPSSLMFAAPRFSADIERLTTLEESHARWPAGSAMVSFVAGDARVLGFVARHEPELGNAAHANVDSELGSSQRKKMARTLASKATVRIPPPVDG